MNKTNFLLYFLFFLAQTQIVTAQKEKESIKFIRYPDINKVATIEFFNPETGALINTFSLLENNPYAKLSFSIKKYNTDKNPVYEFSTQPYDNSYFISDVHYDSEESNIEWVESQTGVTTNLKKNSDFVCVSYNLYSYNSLSGRVGGRGTVIILDRKGDIVTKLDHLATEVISPNVSRNGKMLWFKYGVVFDENGGHLYPPSFILYDVESGKAIYNHVQDEEEYIDLSSNIGSNKIITESLTYLDQNGNSQFPPDSKFWIIDTDELAIYTKKIDANTRATLLQVADSYILFKEQDSNTQYRLFYKKDFFTEKLKK